MPEAEGLQSAPMRLVIPSQPLSRSFTVIVTKHNSIFLHTRTSLISNSWYEKKKEKNKYQQRRKKGKRRRGFLFLSEHLSGQKRALNV